MIALTRRERLKRLRLRHKRAKKAIKLETSTSSSERAWAAKYWRFVRQLDREIRDGGPTHD
ncbi:hypothetical protein [Frigoribacterium sp. SL97]|jgi:hypothetical protein|uniref:hypothetical protein n=1 Tax=Frigoribacterium sp. SL97 TaxID=2994664 RepID=UPI0022701AC1|nr:hypothetical protein [Frigoribacterium sp. SL97]WAC50281.1 hypothetical protein OVA02_10300 [Frigoribacterium sp. SL97]